MPVDAIADRALVVQFSPWKFSGTETLLETAGTPPEWAERYQSHASYVNYVAQPLESSFASQSDARRGDAHGRAARLEPLPQEKPRTSILRQLGILTSRTAKLMRRDRYALILILVVPWLLACLDLLITARSMFDPVRGDSLRVTITIGTLVVNALLVGALTQMRVLIKETELYRRERLVNLHVSAYVLSKVTVAAATLGRTRRPFAARARSP